MSPSAEPQAFSAPAQRLMWVAWPAFMVACLLEMLVFALVDPDNLHWFGQAVPLSNMGVYTVAFFLFWLISALAGLLTLLLALPSPVPLELRNKSED